MCAAENRLFFAAPGFSGTIAAPLTKPTQVRQTLFQEGGRTVKFARSLAIGVLFLLCFSVLAQAQAPAQGKPPQFIQVTTTNVKPAAVPDYEDYLKKQLAARSKTPGAQMTTVYALTLGGPGNTYLIATPFEKWADREKWPNNLEMLTKVYGQAEANRLLKSVRDATEHQETEVFAYNANASVNAKVFDPPAPFVNIQMNELQTS
jgi:hypothetical protein